MKRFTLIELLIVVAIIAILAAMLLPTLGKVRYSAKKTSCSNHVKQLTTGLIMYCDDFKQWTVPDGTSNTAGWVAPYRIRNLDSGATFGSGILYRDKYSHYKLGICPLDPGADKDFFKKWVDGGTGWLNQSYDITYQRRLEQKRIALFTDNLIYVRNNYNNTGISTHNHRQGKPDISVGYSDGSLQNLKIPGLVNNFQEDTGSVKSLFDEWLTPSYGHKVYGKY